MKLYELAYYSDEDGAGHLYASSLREIDGFITRLRKNKSGYPSELRQVTTASLKARKLYCALLNNFQCFSKRETIKTYPIPDYQLQKVNREEIEEEFNKAFNDEDYGGRI